MFWAKTAGQCEEEGVRGEWRQKPPQESVYYLGGGGTGEPLKVLGTWVIGSDSRQFTLAALLLDELRGVTL